MKRIFICVFLCICLFTSVAFADIEVLFCNVGKADAAIVWIGDEIHMIDTGHKNSYEHLSFLLSACGIDHLDGVWISHTDKDHVGGLKKLAKNGFSIGHLYASPIHTKVELEDHTVAEVAEKYDIPLTWLAAGEKLNIGDTSVTVLGPMSCDVDNENNNSLVLLFSCEDGKLLFPGDMETEEENELLEAGVLCAVDVLKVAHHGDNDATGKTFALVTRPKLAIISTNTQEEPDTPDGRITRRLESVGSVIAVTQDAEAGILVRLSKGNIEWYSLSDNEVAVHCGN